MNNAEEFRVVMDFKKEFNGKDAPFYSLKISTSNKMSQDEIKDWLSWSTDQLKKTNQLTRVK